MPYELKLDERPAGYAIEGATGEEGTLVRVAVREFTSSEDGEHFLSRLEGFPSVLLSKLPAEAIHKPSQVDHLLAIIRKDLSATLYINEIKIVLLARTRSKVSAGQQALGKSWRRRSVGLQ